MSILVVQVGQCGNQLGLALWQALLASTRNGQDASPFFTRSGKARCVLVDAEPKVVESIVARHPTLFHQDATACGQSGRGNNWALGYNGVNQPGSRRAVENAKQQAFSIVKNQREDDTYLIPKALCAIHRECLRCEIDQIEAIVVLHSLAGGTGSGVTSRLVEKIRLYFTQQADDKGEQLAEEQWEADGLSAVYGVRRKALYVVSIAVAPQVQGENALQGINTALTLRSLHKAVDAIIILRNDDAFHPMMLSNTRACESFEEANSFFAKLLMPLLLFGTSPRPIGELVEKCCPDPKYKMLSIIPLPQRSFLRFKRSVVLSRHYKVRGAVSASTTDVDDIPFREIHREASARMLDVTSGVTTVCPPKSFVSTCSSEAGTTARGGGGSSYNLCDMLFSVVVLNQVEELNKSVMFPLLRDCALKVKARAFLTEYISNGLQEEALVQCYREVAAVLTYPGT